MWSLDATSEVTAEEEAREKQLASNDLFFKRALENGARMMRHDNTTQSAHSIIRQFLANRPQPLQIQRELVDEKKSLAATDAGFHMNEEWKALSERYRKEIEEIRNQQRQEIEALTAANAQLLEKSTTSEGRHVEEIKALQGVIVQMTKELRETRETLNEEREKVRKLDQQMQLLTEAGTGLDRRMSETARRVDEDLKKIRRQQRKNTGSVAGNSRLIPSRRPMEEEPVAEEKDRPTLKITPRQRAQPQPEKDEGLWCVVQ